MHHQIYLEITRKHDIFRLNIGFGTTSTAYIGFRSDSWLAMIEHLASRGLNRVQIETIESQGYLLVG